MARIETDPNYSTPTFSRATAGTDLFKKEDVQQLAAAVSTHDHSSGKGAVLAPGAIPVGSITSGMIADGTIVAGDLADGAVTSAKILDGTIATIDIADKAVTNAKLGADTARANLFTNGGFEIWQRGPGPFTAIGAYGPDRWQTGVMIGDTLSLARDTVNVDTSSGAACACVFTLSGGGGQTRIDHNVENFGQLRGRTLTVTMRVKTNVPNAVRVALNDLTLTYSPFHSGSGTYETLTVTKTMSASSSVAYVQVYFAASCTAYLDNAMLVIGSVPSDYVPLHPAEDLARCLRYYEKLGASGTSMWVSAWAGAGALPLGQSYLFGTKKAVTPTLTKAGTWYVSNCAQPVADIPELQGFRTYAVATAPGVMSYYCLDATTFIAVEANPA